MVEFAIGDLAVHDFRQVHQESATGDELFVALAGRCTVMYQCLNPRLWNLALQGGACAVGQLDGVVGFGRGIGCISDTQAQEDLSEHPSGRVSNAVIIVPFDNRSREMMMDAKPPRYSQPQDRPLCAELR